MTDLKQARRARPRTGETITPGDVAPASPLDPICLHCVVPMQLTVAGCPLLPRRFLAECPACGRTVAVTLTARVLWAGPLAPRECTGPGGSLSKCRRPLAHTGVRPHFAHIPSTPQPSRRFP